MEDRPIQTLVLEWTPTSTEDGLLYDYEVTLITPHGRQDFLFSSSKGDCRERDCEFLRYVLDDAETIFGDYAEPSTRSISAWLLAEGICDQYDNVEERSKRILDNWLGLSLVISQQDQKNLLWALRLMGF